MEASYLFFSAEAKAPTGYQLINIIHPIEKKFNEQFASKYTDDTLENVTIVFICTDEEMISRGFYPERRYISWKKKYADIRLIIPYLEFLRADEKTKKAMMWEVIARALDYLRKKKALQRIDEFEKDLHDVYWTD